jgi:hypothetical protein
MTVNHSVPETQAESLKVVRSTTVLNGRENDDFDFAHLSKYGSSQIGCLGLRNLSKNLTFWLSLDKIMSA